MKLHMENFNNKCHIPLLSSPVPSSLGFWKSHFIGFATQFLWCLLVVVTARKKSTSSGKEQHHVLSHFFVAWRGSKGGPQHIVVAL